MSCRSSLLMMLMIRSTSGKSSFLAIDESLRNGPSGAVGIAHQRFITSRHSFIRSYTTELLFLATSLSHLPRCLADRTCACSSPPTGDHTARMDSLRASPCLCIGLAHRATPDDRSRSFQRHRRLSPSLFHVSTADHSRTAFLACPPSNQVNGRNFSMRRGGAGRGHPAGHRRRIATLKHCRSSRAGYGCE